MAENNATKPNPGGTVKKNTDGPIRQHKLMAMGQMPEVGGGPKTPA